MTRPELLSELPLNDVINNQSVTKAPKKIQKNGKRYAQMFNSNKFNFYFSMKPNCLDIELDADRSTFGSDNSVFFSETICEEVGSENMPIDNLQSTLCFTNAQINQVEELKQFFHNKNVVDKEKIAEIEHALRNPTI